MPGVGLQGGDTIPVLPPLKGWQQRGHPHGARRREGFCPEAGGCWRIPGILAARGRGGKGRCSAGCICLPALPACSGWACCGRSPVSLCALVQIPGPEGTRWTGTLAMPRMHLDNGFVNLHCSFLPEPASSGSLLQGVDGHINNNKYNRPGLVFLAGSWACVRTTEQLLLLIPKQGDPVYVASCPKLLGWVYLQSAPWFLWMQGGRSRAVSPESYLWAPEPQSSQTQQ